MSEQALKSKTVVVGTIVADLAPSTVKLHFHAGAVFGDMPLVLMHDLTRRSIVLLIKALEAIEADDDFTPLSEAQPQAGNA